MKNPEQNSITCNKSQLASILGVTTRTLTDWQKEYPPLPIQKTGEVGRSNTYDVGLCVRWYIQREKNDAEQLDLDQERALLAREQRLRTEQDRLSKADELLNRESVLRTWSGVLAELRAKILNADLTDQIKSDLIENLRDIPFEKYAE